MRSVKDILFVIVIALVVFGQVYYLFNYYKKDMAQIAENKRQIQEVEIKIQGLEERLAHFEETKKELEDVKREQIALAEQLPNQNVKIRFLSEMLDYASLMKCDKISVIQENKDVITSNIGNVGVITNTLKFISTYDSSEKLVGNLNNMYQACNIQSFIFESGAYDDQDADLYKLYFGKDFDSVGQTTLVYNTYYLTDDTISDEVYEPNITGKYNVNPFKKMDAKEGEEGKAASNDASPINPQTPGDNVIYPNAKPADFSINIGDILTSGDVYKISGPGESTNSYIGLNSRSDTTITISVYDDGYELTVEDKEGNRNESGLIDYTITNPTCHINSNVHVNIYNYASTKMNVVLAGSMTNNVHIFTTSGEEIFKGESKGNVSLT